MKNLSQQEIQEHSGGIFIELLVGYIVYRILTDDDGSSIEFGGGEFGGSGASGGW